MDVDGGIGWRDFGGSLGPLRSRLRSLDRPPPRPHSRPRFRC